MILYHVTPTKNVEGIMREGLLPSRAKGGRQAVWAAKRAKLAWAILHVSQHQQCSLDQLTVLIIHVPWEWCRKSGRLGVWYIPFTVPPERVHGSQAVGVLTDW